MPRSSSTGRCRLSRSDVARDRRQASVNGLCWRRRGGPRRVRRGAAPSDSRSERHGIDMGMGIQRVGHVVIKMRDLEKAKQFYHGVLGMEIAAERDFGIFFRFDNYHHDIAVFKTSPDAEPPKRDQVGLVH